LLLLPACVERPASQAESEEIDTVAVTVSSTVPPPESVSASPAPKAATSRVVRTAAGDVSDSATEAPRPDELARLSAELMIPLPGVAPEALVDSYNDARSGGRAHHALDIRAPRWTPVLSAADGRVLKLHTSVAGGLMVYAAEPMERFVLMYGHLQEYARGLAEGASLRRGDTLGFVGTSGNAAPDAPHLHFAIAYTADVDQWWTGTPVDPKPLLRR
jgi:peptidoglycan LD-endopeptidase LytH